MLKKSVLVKENAGLAVFLDVQQVILILVNRRLAPWKTVIIR